MSFSIQVLCYGDHTDLATRCLGSIEDYLPPGPSGIIQDVRIGLNAVSPATLQYCRDWAGRVSDRFQLPVLLYLPPVNAFKYPLMRKMFRNPQHPLPEWVMWFDDDSYLTGVDPKFFETWHKNCAKYSQDQNNRIMMIGENDWERALQGNQAKYFGSKPWFRGVTWGGRRSPKHVPFITGGWWILNRFIVKKYNWPDPDLRHNGGDQMLGVLLRQQGWITKGSDPRTVAVNADDQGRRSKSKRRGHSESLLGANWQPGTSIQHNFHNFPLAIEEYPMASSGASDPEPPKPSYPKLSGLI